MGIDISKLRKEIDEKEQIISKNLISIINERIKESSSDLFNGKDIKIPIGAAIPETERICRLIKQDYQKTNPELIIQRYGNQDGSKTGGLIFSLEREYLK